MNVHTLVLAFSASLFLLAPFASQAGQTTIDPSSDGSLYTCSDCVQTLNPTLLVAGYIQGVTIFPTASIPGNITSATLSLNPYALPLFAPTIDVYGFSSNTGIATIADANTGVFLGAWAPPANLNYGQDAFFNVTGFVESTNSPYVGFNLRAPGGPDTFSSVAYNYGHPDQLTVIKAAEPGTLPLLSIGMLALVVGRLRARRVSQIRLPVHNFFNLKSS